MICPNCGRRNSAGATFCSRCRQRLPLATKLDGNHRRTVMVEPRGGGGSGAIVLGVALLAGFLFIGGAAAIYLSNPPSDGGHGTDISFASSTPSLPIFVQPTATPSPTPTPTFILLPSDSPTPPFTPLPTSTPGPSGPPTPTPPPTAPPLAAKFTCSQQGTSKTIVCVDHSTGPISSWQWSFGDLQTSSEQNPSNAYAEYRTWKVTLVVTGPTGASNFKQKDVVVQAPPCDSHGQPLGCIASPTPSPSPSPTPVPTPTPTTPTPTLPQPVTRPFPWDLRAP